MRRRLWPWPFALALISSSSSSSPPALARPFAEAQPWTPAVETGNAVFFGDAMEMVAKAQAQAPLPTEAPRPRSRFAGMRLLGRDDGTRGYDTCGFDQNDGGEFAVREKRRELGVLV
jgi:hypothetical protein